MNAVLNNVVACLWLADRCEEFGLVNECLFWENHYWTHLYGAADA